MRFLLLTLSFLLFISCDTETTKTLDSGTYRAVLQIQDNQEIPFIFEVRSDCAI